MCFMPDADYAVMLASNSLVREELLTGLHLVCSSAFVCMRTLLLGIIAVAIAQVWGFVSWPCREAKPGCQDVVAVLSKPAVDQACRSLPCCLPNRAER